MAKAGSFGTIGSDSSQNGHDDGTFPYAGMSRIRFKGSFSILFRIPLKPHQRYKKNSVFF